MYKECGQGVRRHHRGLSSWANDRCIVPEVCVSILHEIYYLTPSSLKYHRLHPEYIHTRIEKLGNSYNLRLLLILCDIVRDLIFLMWIALTRCRLNTRNLSENLPRRETSSVRYSLLTITQACLINNVTIIVAFSSVSNISIFKCISHIDLGSFEEAGHYLTTFKQFEFKPPDMIKERTEKDYHSILRTSLTSISKVNKTDVETLRTSFGVGSCLQGDVDL